LPKNRFLHTPSFVGMHYTDVYFENVGGAVWQGVLPLLNKFARVPVCGLIAQYDAAGPAPEPNLLPGTMREVLSKSLTLRGYIPPSITRPSCAPSAPLSPMGASAIARTSASITFHRNAGRPQLRQSASARCAFGVESCGSAAGCYRAAPAEEHRVLPRKEQSSGFTQRKSP
jgi:hypothetical protein